MDEKGDLESLAEQVLARTAIIAPKTCAPNLDFGALAAAGAQSAQWHPNTKNTQKGYPKCPFGEAQGPDVEPCSAIGVPEKHIISHRAGARTGAGGGTPYMF